MRVSRKTTLRSGRRDQVTPANEASQRGQTMTATRPRAGVVANAKRRIGRKFAAGRGTRGVDGAVRPRSDLALQGDAAWRRGIGAAHAHGCAAYRHGERFRHALRRPVRQFGTVEIHPECGAAGAAARTAIFTHDAGNASYTMPLREKALICCRSIFCIFRRCRTGTGCCGRPRRHPGVAADRPAIPVAPVIRRRASSHISA